MSSSEEEKHGHEPLGMEGSSSNRRSHSPTPTCVSMKSDNSVDRYIDFGGGDPSAGHLIQQKRSHSPIPSCVSMKIDQSMDLPLRFAEGGVPAGQSEKKYQEGTSEVIKRSIRKGAPRFMIQGSCMYLRPKDGEPPRRVIMSDEERDAVLTEVHAGHFGVKRMMGKINQRFFWRGIVNDVENWVRTCVPCQMFEKVKTEAPEMKSIKLVSPWYMIGVDLIGPFKASPKNQNRYCLTATDFFTKWVEAIPIKDKKAVATSQAMMDIFYTHGAPVIP